MLSYDPDVLKRFRLDGVIHCYITKTRVALSNEMLALWGLRASYVEESNSADGHHQDWGLGRGE